MSPNQQLKSAALEFYRVLYKYLGSRIQKFVIDLNDKQKKILNSEFESIPNDDMIQNPLSQYEGPAVNILKKKGKSLDALFPKVNLSNAIGDDEMKSLSENNWQKRKAVLEKICNELHISNYQVANSGFKEILDLLVKVVSNEKNKSVKKQALETLDMLGRSLEFD